MKVEEEEHFPAVSSHYASAESDADENYYTEIKRMSVGPSRSAILRDHHEHTAPAKIATVSPTTTVPTMDESDQMQIHFAKAMDTFLQDQHSQLSRTAQIGRLTPKDNVFECVCQTPICKQSICTTFAATRTALTILT